MKKSDVFKKIIFADLDRIMISCIAICIIVTSLLSCNSDDTEKYMQERMFRPVSFRTSITGNNVSFSWTPIGGATYLLEISRDSMQFVRELQVIPLGKVSGYRVGDLWSNNRYSARIKSISLNPDIQDSEYQEITFVTQTENIFYSVENDAIGADQILLKWDNTKNVDRIVVSTAGLDDVFVSISGEEKAAGEKTITGLNANTTYTFRIYLGEMLRGTISATTNDLP